MTGSAFSPSGVAPRPVPPAFGVGLTSTDFTLAVVCWVTPWNADSASAKSTIGIAGDTLHRKGFTSICKRTLAELNLKEACAD